MLNLGAKNGLVGRNGIVYFLGVFFQGAGPKEGVKHRGQRDLPSLEKFVKQQMGEAEPEEKPKAHSNIFFIKTFRTE